MPHKQKKFDPFQSQISSWSIGCWFHWMRQSRSALMLARRLTVVNQIQSINSEVGFRTASSNWGGGRGGVDFSSMPIRQTSKWLSNQLHKLETQFSVRKKNQTNKNQSIEREERRVRWGKQASKHFNELWSWLWSRLASGLSDGATWKLTLKPFALEWIE